MPELPEVETIARSLRPLLVGRALGRVWTSGHALRRPIDDDALRSLAGRRIEAIERRGKYLIFRLSRGQVLVWHLGMSGRLMVCPRRAPRPAHTHVVFGMGDDQLRYVDPRRFGLVAALDEDELPRFAELRSLGIDPMGAAFTREALSAALDASRRVVKDFLLDQSRVAGLGNIYAAEALFQARISPLHRADALGPDRARRLHAAIADVIGSAVARRGTSFSDYVDGRGQAGDNQPHLAVYGREGLACRRCGKPVRRLVQGARSTFHCPSCQR